jgi:hypothetical protein
MNTKIESIA